MMKEPTLTRRHAQENCTRAVAKKSQCCMEDEKHYVHFDDERRQNAHHEEDADRPFFDSTTSPRGEQNGTRPASAQVVTGRDRLQCKRPNDGHQARHALETVRPLDRKRRACSKYDATKASNKKCPLIPRREVDRCTNHGERAPTVSCCKHT